MPTGKRASMREGPLAALFRKTAEDAGAKEPTPEQGAPTEQQAPPEQPAPPEQGAAPRQPETPPEEISQPDAPEQAPAHIPSAQAPTRSSAGGLPRTSTTESKPCCAARTWFSSPPAPAAAPVPARLPSWRRSHARSARSRSGSSPARSSSRARGGVIKPKPESPL